MFFYRLKNCIRVFAAMLITAACLGCVWLASVCKLSNHGGERVFYVNSPSSQGLRKTQLNFSDLFRIEGECVRYPTETSEEEFLQELLSCYQAELLFVEKLDRVTSYYCYADGLGKGILINGQSVNLHGAWKEGEAVVGTPIIFDGY